MSVTKLGETAFKVGGGGGGGDRKRRFGRLKISPQKRQVADTDSKKWALNAKTHGYVVNYHPSNWVKCSCLLEGQEKKLPFFFYPKQAIANKAAKMSDLALLL